MIDLEDIENSQLYAGIFVVEILVWGTFGLTASAGWIPAWTLFAAVGGLFNVVVLFAVYYVSSDTDIGFSRFQVPAAERENRLSEQSAFELTRFLLLYRRGIRISEIADRGIVPPKPGSDDSDGSEDSRRLFKLVFERVNVNEKVGVYVDLEQSIEVDLDDYSSLSNAADQIENIRVIRGSKTTAFWKELQEAQVSMGRNSESMIRITDGEGKTAEYPVGALPKSDRERFLEAK